MKVERMGEQGQAPAGWIFFDAECPFCVACRDRWGRIFERRGFVWVPLQTPGAEERLKVGPAQMMSEMWLLPAEGQTASGVDAWIALMASVWWLKPMALLLRLPGIHGAAQTGYRWVARNRHCMGGQCRLPPPKLTSGED
jgi:predicted DCC family thiol-disulfide oxidoreductase YuxK